MTATPDAPCRHCLLPVGRRGFARTVNGEALPVLLALRLLHCLSGEER